MSGNREAMIFDIGRYRGEDGPGIRTTVFFKGCPLRCKWCSNPFGLKAGTQIVFRAMKCTGCGACVSACHSGCNRVSAGRAEVDFPCCTVCGDCVQVCLSGAREIVGEKRDVRDIFDSIRRDEAFYRRTQGGMTLSGGEVLLQHEAAAELLRLGKESLFLHTAIETSAYGKWEYLERLAALCDFVFVDMKFWDPVQHKAYTGVDNHGILENIEALCALAADRASLRVVIRRPVIGGVNDDAGELSATAAFVRRLPGSPLLNLLPYHALGVSKYAMVGMHYEMENKNPLTAAELAGLVSLCESAAPGLSVSIGGGEL